MLMDFSAFPEQMRAAQDGDRRARHDLLARLRPWLLAYYVRRVPIADAEDLAQTTLFAVHRHAGSYNTGAPFLPWLKAIVTRNLIDHYRRRSRLCVVERECGNLAAVAPLAETAAACPRLDLARMLGALPAAQSRSIVLVKIDGLTNEEAAARLGTTQGAVKLSVHRGMRRLQGQREGAA